MKLVDILDLGSSAARHGGSSPSTRTIFLTQKFYLVQISHSNSGIQTIQIHCVISPDDYKTKVSEALKKYSRKIDLKGFRKGQVPAGLVKKMYGNSILAEELNTMVQDNLHQYLETNSFEILGQPLPLDNQKLDLQIDSPSEYTFLFEVGIAPEFKISLDHLSFEQYEIIVDDKMIDEEVDMLRKRNGKQSDAEVVEEKDVLYAELAELTEEGVLKENGITNSTSFNTDVFKDEFKSQILGLKKGDSIKIPLYDAMDRDRDSINKFILNVKPEDINDDSGNHFQLSIQSISRLQPAELNAELFDMLYEPGTVLDEVGMREKITNDLSTYFNDQTLKRVLTKLGRDLISETPMDIPVEFLKRWIQQSNEKPITPEDIERDYPDFEKQLKWDLIQNKVAKENNLQVEYPEILQRTRQIVQNQLLQYGLGYLPEEQLDRFADRYLKDKTHIRKTHETLLEEKVLYRLKQDINIVMKPISLDEYNVILKEETEVHHHEH